MPNTPTAASQYVGTVPNGSGDIIQFKNKDGQVVSWIDATGTGQGTLATSSSIHFSDEEIPSGAMPGTSFTLAYPPNPAKSLFLVWNGLVLKPDGVDYTLSGSSITTVKTIGTATGDSFICWYRY